MISSASYFKGFYDATRNMGDKAIVPDASFVTEGFEHIALKAIGFSIQPNTVLTIESPAPMSSTTHQLKEIRNVQKLDNITLLEAKTGDITAELISRVIDIHRPFNAKLYLGAQNKFTQACSLLHCTFQPNSPTPNCQNRNQLLRLDGTLSFQLESNAICWSK